MIAGIYKTEQGAAYATSHYKRIQKQLNNNH